MKLTHLDLPRHFTFTVREYQVESAAAVATAGHAYTQFDSNPIFWHWLLTLRTPGGVEGCWDSILDHSTAGAIFTGIRSFRTQTRSVSNHYGIAVESDGLALSRAVANSTRAMQRRIDEGRDRRFFARFFSHLDSGTRFTDADILSVGVESAAGVFWALHLATWLRARGWAGHLCIGRHGHENFSLLHSLDHLERGVIFEFVDSIVLHEEEQPAAFAGLLTSLAQRDPATISNLVWRTPTGEICRSAVDPLAVREIRAADGTYAIPDDYFAAMPVPRDYVVYAMAMCRNKCFYSRCSFCAQIARHLSDVSYESSNEVARSLAAAAELVRHGVRMINFIDEAMRPVDVRRFAMGMHVRGLALHWVGRMIAAADPDRELIREMRAAGCVEILFGLETFDPETAGKLGKISGRHPSPETAIRLIETFNDEGIFTILSMITASPVTSQASVEVDEQYLERVTQCSRNVAVIVNSFVLFRASRMFAEPASFGIGAIEAPGPGDDLQTAFAWYPVGDSRPASLLDHEQSQRWKMGLSAVEYCAVRLRHTADELECLHFWDYCSLGLRHRISQGKTMLAECFPRDSSGASLRPDENISAALVS